MYRSDVAPVISDDAPAAAAALSRPTVELEVDADPPLLVAPAWVVIDGNGRSPQPRVERRVERPAEPRPAPATRLERGWIESGLYIATLPMTFTLGLMLAPVVWMFGGRSRQTP